ncbi:hypothetical protein [Clostridium botulinum]|uniref:Uncharacterized protein n=1 Tax=Clostridium botulinum TaxID=1491 RepID=A0A1L7JNI2_CLOBO|nr:hypothetical protein [Clostridium botulinum]APU87244.1 hypothetical protein NPD8_4177 [Clostridium botulinum]
MSGLLRKELEVRNFVNQLGFATKDQIIKLMNLEGKHTQIPDILVTKNALKTDFFTVKLFILIYLISIET